MSHIIILRGIVLSRKIGDNHEKKSIFDDFRFDFTVNRLYRDKKP